MSAQPAEPLASYPPAVSLAPRSPLVEAIARLAAGASFEIAARDQTGLDAARGALAPGATVSITWLPDDTEDDRVAAARRVRDAGYEPLPHVAARRLPDEATADRLISRLRDAADVTQLFLVAGDSAQPLGPYASSLELLARIDPARYGIRRVGFAAFPEGHPLLPDAVMDGALDTKLAVAADAGLDPFVVTQFAFDAAPILQWLKRFRARAATAPVRIGLTGPAGVRTLLHFARICGIGVSARALISNGASLARLLTEAGPDPVLRTLASTGVSERLGPVAVHLFPFGGLERTARWIGPVAQGRLTLRPTESGFRIDD